MKKSGVGILSIIWLLSACVSEQENVQIIFERDLQSIEEYIAENPISAVKEYTDPSLGVRILWQELSGSGKLPEVGDTLEFHYVGKLLDNSVFDTSVDTVAQANNIYNPSNPYEPLEIIFGYGLLIGGFEFGLSKMEEGDKATILIPSLYGYGQSQQGRIPKNSVLIFEVDLLKIKGTEEPDEL